MGSRNTGKTGEKKAPGEAGGKVCLERDKSQMHESCSMDSIVENDSRDSKITGKKPKKFEKKEEGVADQDEGKLLLLIQKRKTSSF